MMLDPNFLHNVLSGLPGVDPEDEELKKALRDLEEACHTPSIHLIHHSTHHHIAAAQQEARGP